MTDWQTNFPLGVTFKDVSGRDQHEDDEDDEFWSQWWDEKCRFAEENERGE
jgi:hypothetical protein